MKRQSNNKYQGTKFNAFRSEGKTVIKHANTFPFVPGNHIEEVVSMPAYNSAGREYKRILPKIRDQKQIDMAALADSINRVQPSKNATCNGDGITINNVEITLKNGIASFQKSKIRFSNLLELLDQLKTEQILNCKKGENLLIRYKYSDSCLKH